MTFCSFFEEAKNFNAMNFERYDTFANKREYYNWLVNSKFCPKTKLAVAILAFVCSHIILSNLFMSYSRSAINLTDIFLSLIKFLSNKLKQRKHKIHDYTGAEYGKDYIFEFSKNYQDGYMTALGKGVRCDDYIIIRKGSQYYRYQVKEIDYYSNPSDIWIALLQKARDS